MKIRMNDLRRLIREAVEQAYLDEEELDEEGMELGQGHEDESYLAQPNREGDGYKRDIFGNLKNPKK